MTGVKLDVAEVDGPAPRARIVVKMSSLSYDDMADVGQLVYDELGLTLTELQESPRQALAGPAFATIVVRKTNPSFTFAEARAMPVGDIVVDAGEVDPTNASFGATPPSLPAAGD